MKKKDSAGGRQSRKDGKGTEPIAASQEGKVLPLPVSRRAPAVEETTPARRKKVERAAMEVRRFLLLEAPDLAESLGHSDLAAQLIKAASSVGGWLELDAVVQTARHARSMFMEFQRDMGEAFGDADDDQLEAAVHDEFVAVLERTRAGLSPQAETLRELVVRLAERELGRAEARVRSSRRLLAAWSTAEAFV